VGTARYVRDAGRTNVADVAIEVADEFQRMRIGTALASLIIQRARSNGVTSLKATTLWDNRAARGLLRDHGFRPQGSRGGEIEYEIELEELAPDRPEVAASGLPSDDASGSGDRLGRWAVVSNGLTQGSARMARFHAAASSNRPGCPSG
jgi:hypothetical protein